MASVHNVVQEAGVPFMPSTSTTQSRHDPKGFSESVAHSRGMSTPASVAARRTDVPAGTSTSWPSMLTRAVAGPSTAGVPWSSAAVPGWLSIAVMVWLLRQRGRADA